MLISVALRRRLYKTSRCNQSKSFVIVPSNGKNTNSVAVYNYSSVRIYRLLRVNFLYFSHFNIIDHTTMSQQKVSEKHNNIIYLPAQYYTIILIPTISTDYITYYMISMSIFYHHNNNIYTRL